MSCQPQVLGEHAVRSNTASVGAEWSGVSDSTPAELARRRAPAMPCHARVQPARPSCAQHTCMSQAHGGARLHAQLTDGDIAVRALQHLVHALGAQAGAQRARHRLGSQDGRLQPACTSRQAWTPERMAGTSMQFLSRLARRRTVWTDWIAVHEEHALLPPA